MSSHLLIGEADLLGEGGAVVGGQVLLLEVAPLQLGHLLRGERRPSLLVVPPTLITAVRG